MKVEKTIREKTKDAFSESSGLKLSDEQFAKEVKFAKSEQSEGEE